MPTLVPARPASTADAQASERARRYQEAQSHEMVRDLIKRFDADIVARELLDDEA